MKETILILVMAAVFMGAIWAVWFFHKPERRRAPKSSTMQFAILNAPSAGHQAQAVTAVPMAPDAKCAFSIQAKHTNPDGWCLKTGTQVRLCTCELHREVH